MTVTTSGPKDAEAVLSGHKARKGWAGFINKMGGSIPPKPDSEEGQEILSQARKDAENQERRESIRERVRQELPREYARRPLRIVTLGTKGGVGKTTSAIALAKTLASERADTVTLVNADPSVGNLTRRMLGKQNPLTGAPGTISHFAEQYREDLAAQQFLIKAEGESVTVLSTDSDPEVTSAYDQETLDKVLAGLRLHANFVVIDNGAEVSNKFGRAGLAVADAVVVVTDNTDDAHDGLPRVAGFLQKEFPNLLEHTSVVVNRKALLPPGLTRPPGSRDTSTAAIMRIAEEFGIPSTSGISVPYDPTLQVGGQIDFEQMGDETRAAYETLAAAMIQRAVNSAA